MKYAERLAWGPPRIYVPPVTFPERSRQNPFAALTFDRLAVRRDDTAWLDATSASPSARFLVLDPELRAFVTRDAAGLQVLDATDRARLLPGAPAYLLGESASATYFALRTDATQAAALVEDGASEWQGLREIGLTLQPLHAGLFAYARGLLHWQNVTRYCSKCGTSLTLAGSGHRGVCGHCGLLHFPRTDAAVIVIVEHEGACLLGRQAVWPAGRYSTLAGFVEPGETLEDAVRREVGEEAGVDVLACEYHSSQPWPFPASLMVAFTALARDRAIHLADGELEDARWFTAAEIANGVRSGSLLLPPPLSVSFRLIEHWLAERAGIALSELLAGL